MVYALTISLLAGQGNAQGLPQGRPDVGSASIAGENGPGTLWVNPANLAYDPDARYGVYYTAPVGAGPRIAAFTFGAQGLQLAARALRQGDSTDWTFDYATGIQLPERLAVGLMASWTLVKGGQNFVGYDLGLSWRPLPWLGVAGVAQNVGSPDVRGRVLARSGAGIALRPFGPALVLGADWARTFPAPSAGVLPASVPSDLARASIRLRPTEGLYLRSSIDLDTTDLSSPTLYEVGFGAEVYFGGAGGGYQQRVHGDALAYTAFAGTAEPGESLARSRREVPTIELDFSPAYQPRSSLLGPAPRASWLDVLERLRRAEQARGIAGAVVRLDDVSLPFARWAELRVRLTALRDAGRPVLVYLGGSPDNGAYWAATAANKVLAHPAGQVELVGISAERTYYKGLLDLVGVEAEFVRRSEYKSAPETYLENSPTAPSTEQEGALLDDLYENLVHGIAEGRGQSEAQVHEWIDGGPWTAEEALQAGMIDGLAYPDELDKEAGKLIGKRAVVTNLLTRPLPISPWEAPAQIAVIYIEGAIVDGRSSSGGLLGGGPKTGAATVLEQLEAARLNPHVKALVLRVDSPGGSAFASDVIWRGLQRVKDTGKPVVVSMGGVAASGGYYVAAAADSIYAEPTTITGSIGVFSGKFNTEGLFEDIGIGVSRTQRGAHAGLYSSNFRWTPEQRERIESMVESTYMLFKQRVADGRGMSLDEVEEVARGRVWSGEDAQSVGLVNELGGLQEAIADAKERAGIRTRQKVALVTPTASNDLFASLAPTLLRATLGPVPDMVKSKAHITVDLPRLPNGLVAPSLFLSEPGVMVWAMDPAPLVVDPR